MTDRKTPEDFLRERILNSGFPLEIEISEMLETEFSVNNSRYYYDKESENGRTIDIFAHLKSFNFEGCKEVFPFFNLVIECKKSNSHAWIFFTRPMTLQLSEMAEKISGHILSLNVPNSTNRYSDFNSSIANIICPSLHYHAFERAAIAYDEIKCQKAETDNDFSGRDNKKRDDILEGIMQVQKFICSNHRKDELLEGKPELLIIYTPVIVFDGELFESYFDSGKLELQKSEHIIIKSDYFCPYCKKIETFTIDVVHRSYFSKFIQTIKETYFESLKAIQKQQEAISKAADAEKIKIKEKQG